MFQSGRTMRAIATTIAGAVLLTACSTSGTTPPTSLSAPAPTTAGINQVAATALVAADAAAQQSGVTYDVKRVPLGSKMSVGTSVADGRTTVELEVSGLLPNTKYGAHVHTKACGAKAADSGPHYQNEKDPVTPSVDPKYANAENEIWLDFTTDAQGGATGKDTVKWEFRKGDANSVVLHASHTSTEHGKAGTAGDRLACLTAQL